MGIGRLCSSAAQHVCCGAHPGHSVLPGLTSMEYRNRWDQRAGEGVEVDGRHRGANRWHRVVGRATSGGCAARLASTQYAVRSPAQRMCCGAHPGHTVLQGLIEKMVQNNNGGFAAWGNVLWRRVAPRFGTLRGRICLTKLTGSGAQLVESGLDQHSPVRTQGPTRFGLFFQNSSPLKALI